MPRPVVMGEDGEEGDMHPKFFYGCRARGKGSHWIAEGTSGMWLLVIISIVIALRDSIRFD